MKRLLAIGRSLLNWVSCTWCGLTKGHGPTLLGHCWYCGKQQKKPGVY